MRALCAIALALALSGCDEPQSMTTRGIIERRLVVHVLYDGSRCAVIQSGYGIAMDCDWWRLPE